MSSAFCSLDDAFAGPVMPQKKKKSRTGSGSGREGPTIEGFVPAPLENTSAMVDPDRLVQKTPPVEVLTGPASEGRVDANMVGADFFPLPGGTANAEEWQKAFMLEPTQIAGLSAGYGSRASLPSMPSSSVSGKPTLWRDIPASSEAPAIKTAHTGGNTTDASISQRLDTLTRQLEALTAPTPLQSTAELFLFVAIGLLLLLAIDTLLRFATAIAKSRSAPQVGGGGGWRSLRPRRFR